MYKFIPDAQVFVALYRAVLRRSMSTTLQPFWIQTGGV